ncbi:MAG TPA: hypothetical protein VMW53_07090 [archaeon]|nr:hypothetical protein [archaeon]HUW66606.1 hypothetical protein [Candidatus Nanoarchaeia archaeon]
METKLDVFEKFDQCYPKFKWFIEKHFKDDVIEKIESARIDRNNRCLLSILNMIWFYLPDDEYNIMTNPPGWSEFLYVITPE